MAQAKPPLPFPRDPFLLIDEDLLDLFSTDATPLSEECAESVRQHCYAALRDIFLLVPTALHHALYTNILLDLIEASSDPRELLEAFLRAYTAERKARNA